MAGRVGGGWGGADASSQGGSLSDPVKPVDTYLHVYKLSAVER